MKNTILKNIGKVLLYWLLLVSMFILINFLRDKEEMYTVVSMLSIFLLFIAPFCFIVPYRLIKTEENKSKIVYLFLGLIIPYLVIYLLFYLDVNENFHPGF